MTLDSKSLTVPYDYGKRTVGVTSLQVRDFRPQNGTLCGAAGVRPRNFLLLIA